MEQFINDNALYIVFAVLIIVCILFVGLVEYLRSTIRKLREENERLFDQVVAWSKVADINKPWPNGCKPPPPKKNPDINV